MSTTVTPPVTFSNFTGIDFNQIILAETAAAQIPIGSLNSQITGENTQITSLGAISATLSLLQASLTNLNTDAITVPQAVTVQSASPFSATVNGSPANGVYNVSVQNLATSQMSASQGFASNTSTIGTGTLTLTIGGSAHPITVDSTNNTLDGLAGAINSANLGVSAQVVNTGLAGAPYRLEIASSSTGAANAFSVSSNLSGGPSPDFNAGEVGPVSLDSVTGTATPTIAGTYSGTLSQSYHFTVISGGTVGTDALTIAYTSDSGATGTITVPSSYIAGGTLNVAAGLTLALNSGTLNSGDNFSVATFNPDLATAQNAQVQVGNQIVTSSTNAVTNAIPGVTLNLTAAGGPSTVTVGPNVSGMSNDVATFVNTYNALLSAVTTMTQAQPGLTPPALANNPGVEAMMQNLTQSLGAVNLSTLGISIDNKTGQLVYNGGTFATNAAATPTAVTGALSAIYGALNPGVSSALTPATGLIASETTGLQNLITAQNNQVTNLQNQITQEQTTLTNIYAQLQAQVLQYQNVQLYLNAQTTSSTTGGTTPAPVGTGLTVNG